MANITEKNHLAKNEHVYWTIFEKNTGDQDAREAHDVVGVATNWH